MTSPSLQPHPLDRGRLPRPGAASSRSVGERRRGWHAHPSDFDLNPDLAFDDVQAEAGNAAARRRLPPCSSRPCRAPRDHAAFHAAHRSPAQHAGQIAFPGGKTEKSDAGPLATALREAHEEIGLDPALVEPLGFLDSYRTGTGFRITPVVALVDPRFELTLNRDEVADAFEVPLRFLMDTGNHQLHVRTIAGRERRFYAMPYEERFIWGATAGILRNMHERFCLS